MVYLTSSIFGIVTNKTDCTAIHAAKATNDIFGMVRLNLEQVAFISKLK